jgi:hypothetical protein
MINYENARNQINQFFYVNWNLNSNSVAGYVPEIHWQGVEKRGLPDANHTWLRFSQQTVDERQSTLSSDVFQFGEKRYSIEGVLIIQIFAPKSEMRAWENCGKYAQIVKNMFRGQGTQNCIWFRNARIQELPQEELYYRMNVTVEYYYDEVSNVQFPLTEEPPPNIQDVCCFYIDGLQFDEIDCGVIDGGTW